MFNKKVHKTWFLSWFQIAMIGIFLISLGLRFWKLGQFNTLVFDEIYNAVFANNYLIGKSQFNSHPPLSQYLIAIGMWIGSQFPAKPEIINDLTGSIRSTISYRWLNALIGSFIPILVGVMAYYLSGSRSYGIIAALLAASDGLFLVESRYALKNIYLVFFGLLAQLYFLLAIHEKSNKKLQKLIISGVFFGATASIKWNGLGFLLGIYGIFLIFWLIKYLEKNNNIFLNTSPSNNQIPKQNLDAQLWQKITSIKVKDLILGLVIIPLMIYIILWIPHLLINPEYGLWEIHQKMLSFHQNIGNTSEVHPYCSKWYTWLLMWRTVAYYYQIIPDENQDFNSIIYDVHGMGNPILWYLSTIASLSFIVYLGIILIFFFKHKKIHFNQKENWLVIYLTCNYLANLLPWIGVDRCTFLYHYMNSYVFSWLALGWILTKSLEKSKYFPRWIGISLVILIILGFIYWMPIYLGLPLSKQGWKIRMLFPNWI